MATDGAAALFYTYKVCIMKSFKIQFDKSKNAANAFEPSERWQLCAEVINEG